MIDGTPAGMLHPKAQKVSTQSGLGTSEPSSKRGGLVHLLLQIPIQFFTAVAHPDFTITRGTMRRRFPFGLPHLGTTKTADTLVFGMT